MRPIFAGSSIYFSMDTLVRNVITSLGHAPLLRRRAVVRARRHEVTQVPLAEDFLCEDPLGDREVRGPDVSLPPSRGVARRLHQP